MCVCVRYCFLLTYALQSVEGVAVIPLDAISHLSPTPKSKKTKTKKSKKIQSIERGVVFATAGDKGVIRLWDMLNSDPIQTLQPLDQGVSDSPPDSSTPQAYTGLMYSESQGALVGVTYDHNVLFYSQQEEFQKSKQVSHHIIMVSHLMVSHHIIMVSHLMVSHHIIMVSHHMVGHHIYKTYTF